MILVAISEALATTIVYILIWFVLFPGFVMGMIGYAIVVALGEARRTRTSAAAGRDARRLAQRSVQEADHAALVARGIGPQGGRVRGLGQVP